VRDSIAFFPIFFVDNPTSPFLSCHLTIVAFSSSSYGIRHPTTAVSAERSPNSANGHHWALSEGKLCVIPFLLPYFFPDTEFNPQISPLPQTEELCTGCTTF
jgi:hypothetical protein